MKRLLLIVCFAMTVLQDSGELVRGWLNAFCATSDVWSASYEWSDAHGTCVYAQGTQDFLNACAQGGCP